MEARLRITPETYPYPEAEAPDRWQNKAACLGYDSDIFFPERGQTEKVKIAKGICKGCVVQVECAEYAIENRIQHGIWGKLSERQRRAIRRGRKQAS